MKRLGSKRRAGYSLSFISFSLILFCIACNKSHDSFQLGNAILVSETGEMDHSIDQFELSVDGSNDTIYIFSNSEVTISVNDATNWVKILKEEYNERLKSTMVVLVADSLDNDLSKRIGELDMSNENEYSRKFLKLVQGYNVHFSEDFSWLHYGHGNPLDLNEGVLFSSWSPSQKEHGWLSDALQDQTEIYVYGKDEYVQLGVDTAGANLSTPILSGVQDDSLMILSFNAVAFVSKEGIKDNNKLTIRVEGGEFDNGENERVIDLGYIDNGSALITTKMWEGTFYKFEVRKHKNDPFSTTLQIKFVNGDKEESSNNRIFLDNIGLFSKAQYYHEEEEEK